MLTAAILTEHLQAMGMPAASRIEPVGDFWRHAMWRVRFEPGAGQADMLLRQPRVEWLTDSLAHEAAALAILSARSDHGLPVACEYRLLGADLLSRSAALSSLLSGVPGDRLMTSASGPEMVRCMGLVLRRLSGVELPEFGTAAIEGRFVPRRPTWSEEVLLRVDQVAGIAHARGTDLGPLSEEIRGRIEERDGELALASGPTLVHGDLQPGNLLFEWKGAPDEEPPAETTLHLSGVIDWECAVAGDPLVDWALPMLVSTGALAEVVRGYGADAVRALVALPGTVERIEVYWLTHILERLAFAGSELLNSRPILRGLAMEQARLLAVQALDPDNGVRLRFDRALSEERAGPFAAFHRPTPALGLTRSAVERLRFDPPPRAEGAREWILAARFGRIATRPAAQAATDVLADEAEERLATIEPRSTRRFGRPIPDRRAWRDALVGRVCESRACATGSLAPLLLAVALDAIAQLDGAVSDDVLRGLENWVEGHLPVDAPFALTSWADPELIHMASATPDELPDPF